MDANWLELAQMDYQEAWAMQRQLAEKRARSEIADTVMVLQHPHTYTLGSSGHIENLLMSEEERARRGVAVLNVDRGGDITYHGPGQMVAYPILHLGKPDMSGRLPHADYIGYIRKLESVIIDTLRPFNIEARRNEGFTGAWVDTPGGPEKIAAIGVKVTAAGVTMHGLALNVNPDLDFFRGIVPCGLDKPVTSMAALLGDDCPPMADVIAAFQAAFAVTFGYEFKSVMVESVMR